MLSVRVRPNESPERAISKLKNLVVKEGVLNAVKDKRYYTKPCLKRKLKREAAQRQRVKAVSYTHLTLPTKAKE